MTTILITGGAGFIAHYTNLGWYPKNKEWIN
jgi:hypothetical protein